MQIFDEPRWYEQSSVTTGGLRASCGRWCGVAIGPDSDEGVVVVNGRRLQAGRVLPLAAEQYTVERVRPSSVLTEIARLQLLLFEDPAELACEVARPNGQYGGYSAQGEDGLELTVPFVGRAGARLVLRGGVPGGFVPEPGTFAVKLYGQRYSAALGGVHEFALLTCEAELGTVAFTALGFYDPFATLVINSVAPQQAVPEVGAWDALRLSVIGTGRVSVDVETYGELGVSK